MPPTLNPLARACNLVTVYEGVELQWRATDDGLELLTRTTLTDRELDDAEEQAWQEWAL